MKNWNINEFGDATFEKDGTKYMALYDESHDMTTIFKVYDGCMDEVVNYHFGEPDPEETVKYAERW